MPGPTPTSTHSQRQHKFRRPSRLRHNTASAASTSATSGDLDHAPVMSQHQCCGVVEEAALQAREKRANRTTPQPWIVRKLAVFLTLGIMGYAGYVYIGRFCISAINRTGQSATGRPTAIVLLPIFCVLYLWMIWAYIKVILTSPGYAKDYEPQCPQPGFDQPDTRHSDYDLENSLTHYNAGLDLPKSSHEFDPTRTHRYNKPSYSSTSSHHPARGDRVQPPEPIAGPSYEDIVLRTSIQGRSVSLERLRQTTNHEDARASGATLPEEVDDGGVGEGRLRTPFEPPFTIFLPEDHEHSQGETTSQRDGQTLEMGTLGGREPRNNRPQAPAREVPPLATTPEKSRHDKSSWKALFFPCAAFYGKQRVAPREKREITVRRRPPTIPILHPAHRYCFRDQIVKPYRAHHCRNCGTCVLKFDHHCPWIGQCVGARNHKFFLNFCLAAMIFTLYVLGTLVGFNVSAWVSTSSTSHVDSQVIVISSLALLFSLFTSVLTWTHIILIMRGQTTVESMTIHSMKEREGAELTREYGICSFSVKREARKQWNEEWGDLDSEGNIWWTGSKKQGWIDVMGSNPLGWISIPCGPVLQRRGSYSFRRTLQARDGWTKLALFPSPECAGPPGWPSCLSSREYERQSSFGINQLPEKLTWAYEVPCSMPGHQRILSCTASGFFRV